MGDLTEERYFWTGREGRWSGVELSMGGKGKVRWLSKKTDEEVHGSRKERRYRTHRFDEPNTGTVACGKWNQSNMEGATHPVGSGKPSRRPGHKKKGQEPL